MKRALSSPGITLGAPVPALRLDTWKVVGWKCSVPASQRRLVSSARAGASVCTGFSASWG